jgi:secreted PhoX family phosphatase
MATRRVTFAAKNFPSCDLEQGDRWQDAHMQRRDFLRGSASGVTMAVGAGFWREAYAAPTPPGPSPYGAIAPSPDANGLRLPAGFSSRIIARTALPVPGTSHIWHAAPDGGACFDLGNGAWAYTSNSELPLVGGAAVIRFDENARITSAATLCSGTNLNCAGGATPWGTWLSCEEWEGGQVIECYMDGGAPARRTDLGTFSHEAVAVDPAGRRLYLTEDRSDGRFYRFTPDRYPSLSGGRLEAMRVSFAPDGLSGSVSWTRVEKFISAAVNPFTRSKTTAFRGGEGCWYDDGVVYFTTKGDNRVWAHDIAASTLDCIYSASLFPGSPLSGVDNVVMSPRGDLLVAEDGGDMQLCLLRPGAFVAPFLELEGHDGSEITGPAFNPRGDRLYFSSQRGPNGNGLGVTFEVSGPF